jgi:hypothetical protein
MCMLTLCKLTEVFYFPSLVCEDISFGKEDIPIPVINVIDNPPIAPPGKLLTNLCFYEGSGSGRQTIYIYIYISKIALLIYFRRVLRHKEIFFSQWEKSFTFCIPCSF